MENLNAQLTRGKKWLAVKKKAEYEEDNRTLNWLPTQQSIVEDMKAFEEYSKPETKPKEKK